MTGERIERFRFHNRRDAPMELILEPWGMPLAIDAATSVEVELRGPDSGSIDVEVCDPNQVTVYGWPGARVIVMKDGAPLYSTLDGPPVPEVPSGKSVRDFVRGLFGR